MVVHKRIANRFREIVSGSPDGKPEWVKLIAHGQGPGLYGPDSAVWQVHGSVATLVGGIRALLLQAAHPAALSGVKEHSRFESDLLGRLAGTARWLTITTFGSIEAISKEATRVNAMHSRVSGTYLRKDGQLAPYQATDPRFLLWVHCAFTESFLRTHLAMGNSITHGANAYISEWSKSAEGLGLIGAPKSEEELKDVMEDFLENDLTNTPQTTEVVKFILKPPLGKSSLILYRILANAAIATLSDGQRQVLGLKQVSPIWTFLCKKILSLLTLILGPESPSQAIARERIAKEGEQEILTSLGLPPHNS